MEVDSTTIPSISRKCLLYSVDNVSDPILLQHNTKIIIGRSSVTKISDKRCSRHQVSLTADLEELEVRVQQLGNNTTGINGIALQKNETRILRHGDKLELLLGQHIYKVEFTSESSKTSDSVKHYNGLKKKRGDSGSEDSSTYDGLKKTRSDSGSEDSSTRDSKMLLTEQSAVATISGNISLCDKSLEGKWETIGEGKLLLYTPHGLAGRNKIAAYDLDHTVITTQTGKVFPKDMNDWKIAFTEVPGKLKQLWKDQFKIVFFTNQAGIEAGKLKLKDFETKIQRIINKLGVPIQIFVSTGSGIYRKPAPGMWDILVEKMNCGVSIDIQSSFYCGDAAGRVVNWAPKKKKDFSSSDRLFASNVGLKFYTPEEHFLGHRPAKFTLPEFNPSSLPATIPLCEPPTASLTLEEQEIVLLVGYPGSGKSFFTQTYMVPAGYHHVNRDALGSWQQCISTMKSSLQQGKSVIVDNTNPNKESRNRFIEVAKKLGIICRCFLLNTSQEHSKHNNKFREFVDSTHEQVSAMVINMFKSKYEEPTLEEGFREIIKINFIPKFTNKDMEKLYKMYLM